MSEALQIFDVLTKEVPGEVTIYTVIAWDLKWEDRDNWIAFDTKIVLLEEGLTYSHIFCTPILAEAEKLRNRLNEIIEVTRKNSL